VTQPAAGFDPGIASMQAAGIRVNCAEYPPGEESINTSINLMAQKMREGRLDARVRAWGVNALTAAGIDGRGNESTKQRVQVLLDAFRSQTSYVSDPVKAEHVASAPVTLCLDPKLCVKAEDCDGLVTALGSVTLSLGIPTRILKQSFGLDQQEHVLLEVEDEHGNWLPVDPSTNYPVGQSAHAQSEESFDPMSQNSRTTGNSGNEIVSLGKPALLEEFVTPCGCTSGLAAPPAQAFDQAQTDLANQVNGPISAGDVYLGEGKFSDAVLAYQAAGQAGSTSVGPEIDLAGAAWITQPLTHQAWVSNGDLQAIVAAGATADQASMARTYAYNMSALWQQAINDGIAAVVAGQKRRSTSVGTIVMWTLGLGAVAGVVYAKTRKKARRR
jgi:hypothetical protein